MGPLVLNFIGEKDLGMVITRPLLSTQNYPLSMKPKMLRSLFDFYTKTGTPIPPNRILEGLIEESKRQGLKSMVQQCKNQEKLNENLYHEWDQHIWTQFYEVCIH